MNATRDDHVLETVRAQQLDDVLHARLADDRHHRLRLVRGQRAQARALAARHDDGLHRRTARQSRDAVERACGEREPEPRPEEPERPLGALVRDHDEREGRVEHPGGGLPEEVDRELVAAGHEQLVPADEQRVPREDEGERRPRQPVMDEDEQDDRRVDHQPVGERVGDPAERRLHAPAASEPAVELVGHARDARTGWRRASCSRPRPRPARTTKTGISASRKTVSAFGTYASGAGTAEADTGSRIERARRVVPDLLDFRDRHARISPIRSNRGGGHGYQAKGGR